MKTSKLALIGVILASLVSVSSARNAIACQMHGVTYLIYIRNLKFCVNVKNMSEGECRAKFSRTKEQADIFEKKCHEPDAK